MPHSAYPGLGRAHGASFPCQTTSPVAAALRLILLNRARNRRLTLRVKRITHEKYTSTSLVFAARTRNYVAHGVYIQANLVGAYLKKEGDKTEIVEVILTADDAKTIRNREIYFSIVIVDCRNYENRYPVRPYIAGTLASDFNFPIGGEFVTVQGTMPERVLADFPKACVALQGGSYISGKIDSTSIPLVRLE